MQLQKTMRTSKVDLDELQWYYKQGYSDRRIAKELHVCQATVTIQRTKLGLKPLYRFGSIEKFSQVKKQFAKLWQEQKTYKQIQKELNVCSATIYLWVKKLKLPKRDKRVTSIRQEEKCYALRKKGLSDEDIAYKLEIPEKRVKINIGRALMCRCRITPKCPYKALLPETELER